MLDLLIMTICEMLYFIVWLLDISHSVVIFCSMNQVWTHSPILCPCCGIMQVSCHIVKLVLRNNALTTLRGIENLKSLEGLDISYNIISTFSELEFLASLPYLLNLWLEGNPLCCSRWYRAQVFSYFAHPAKVRHDLHSYCFVTL